MKCFFFGLWFNLRYMNDFLLKGFIASGHEYDEHSFVVHEDHWHIFCKRCGSMAATEVHPSRIKEHKNGRNAG